MDTKESIEAMQRAERVKGPTVHVDGGPIVDLLGSILAELVKVVDLLGSILAELVKLNAEISEFKETMRRPLGGLFGGKRP